MLTKFAKKHKHIQSNKTTNKQLLSSTDTNNNNNTNNNTITNTSNDEYIGDDHVVIQEDLILEVRLEKPSKPEKWDLPADISLKSALTRANEEVQSKLDGTLGKN